MDEKQIRADQLVSEIKVLKTVNSGLHSKLMAMESELYSKDVELKASKTRLDLSEAKVAFLEQEKKGLRKRYTIKMDALEKEAKRNDIFNKKVVGTSKTRGETLMIQEMDSLRNVNKTLFGVIDFLAEKIGFDSEILKGLAQVANGVEDNILTMFMESLMRKSDNQEAVGGRDVPTSAIEVQAEKPE